MEKDASVRYTVSERRACKIFLFPQSSHLYISTLRDDRAERMRIKEIAASRPRFGQQRIQAVLRREGWLINHKKTDCIYKEEKLWVHTKKCYRKKIVAILRGTPEKAKSINQIWTMDFVHDQLENGRKIRCLTFVDKFSREALCINNGSEFT